MRRLQRFRTVTRRFWYHLPKDNIEGAHAGTYSAVAVADPVIIKPLRPGRHVVHYYVKGHGYWLNAFVYLHVLGGHRHG